MHFGYSFEENPKYGRCTTTKEIREGMSRVHKKGTFRIEMNSKIILGGE
jgi:hypothetical protein